MKFGKSGLNRLLLRSCLLRPGETPSLVDRRLGTSKEEEVVEEASDESTDNSCNDRNILMRGERDGESEFAWISLGKLKFQLRAERYSQSSSSCGRSRSRWDIRRWQQQYEDRDHEQGSMRDGRRMVS